MFVQVSFVSNAFVLQNLMRRLSVWLCILSERSDCFFFSFVAEFSFFVCVINIQTQNVLLGLCVIHPNMNVSF